MLLISEVQVVPQATGERRAFQIVGPKMAHTDDFGNVPVLDSMTPLAQFVAILLRKACAAKSAAGTDSPKRVDQQSRIVMVVQVKKTFRRREGSIKSLTWIQPVMINRRRREDCSNPFAVTALVQMAMVFDDAAGH